MPCFAPLGYLLLTIRLLFGFDFILVWKMLIWGSETHRILFIMLLTCETLTPGLFSENKLFLQGKVNWSYTIHFSNHLSSSLRLLGGSNLLYFVFHSIMTPISRYQLLHLCPRTLWWDTYPLIIKSREVSQQIIRSGHKQWSFLAWQLIEKDY